MRVAIDDNWSVYQKGDKMKAALRQIMSNQIERL